MHELQKFLTSIISAKRNLKEIYYTTRSPNMKADAKKLVVTAISIQQISEELLDLWRRNKTARGILQDRRAQLTLVGWTKGLPKRVEVYKTRTRKMKGEHLAKYYELITNYLDEIARTLTGWVEDIKGLGELPRPPKD